MNSGEEANPREAGLLFYVAPAAEHVGDALALTAHYCRIGNERYCRIGNEAERLKINRSSENMIVETTFGRWSGTVQPSAKRQRREGRHAASTSL